MRSGSGVPLRHAVSGSRRGFTYVWVLAALAIFSVGLAAVGPLWADAMQREREQELLRIGNLYAHAIDAYYKASPGSLKHYPPTLEGLLLDSRMVGTRRHLRKLYPDPLDPARPWGLLRDADGRIRGVYSRSDAQPLRREPLDLTAAALPAAQRYSDWKFLPKAPS